MDLFAHPQPQDYAVYRPSIPQNAGGQREERGLKQLARRLALCKDLIPALLADTEIVAGTMDCIEAALGVSRSPVRSGKHDKMKLDAEHEKLSAKDDMPGAGPSHDGVLHGQKANGKNKQSKTLTNELAQREEKQEPEKDKRLNYERFKLQALIQDSLCLFCLRDSHT
eukprot:2499461-Rhodomonas_salina.1